MRRSYTRAVAQVIIEDKETGYSWDWGSPEYPFLTSVSIALYLHAVSSFSIGIDIPYDYMLNYMDVHGTSPFKLGNRIKMRLGYSDGDFTQWHHGLLLSGGKGLTVTDEGLSGTLQIVWEGTDDIINQKIPVEFLKAVGARADNLMQRMITLLGFDADISVEARKKLQDMTVAKKNTDVSIKKEVIKNKSKKGKKKSVVKEVADTRVFFSEFTNMTSYEIIKKISNQLGLVWWADRKHSGRKTMFVITNGELTQGIKGRNYYTYAFKAGIDEQYKIMPCFSFEPADDSHIWVDYMDKPEGKSLSMTTINEHTGNIESDLKTTADLDSSVDGYINWDDLKADKDKKAGDIPVNLHSDDSAKTSLHLPARVNYAGLNRLQAEQFMVQGNMGLHGSISTIGFPDEEVGAQCELRGASSLIDGIFLIQGITHDWDGSVWNMTLNVVKYGTGKLVKSGSKITPKRGQVRKKN